MSKSFFSKIKWKYYINYIVIILIVLGLVIKMFNGGMNSSTITTLEQILYSIILAVSLNLVVGFLGELSLGHAGFMCVGAYLGGKISITLVEKFGNGPLALILSIIAGGAAAAICGFIIGLPALRLKGDYLAIVTLGFGEIVRSLFLNTDEKTFNGKMGLATPRYDENFLFLYEFAFVLIVLFVVQNLIRSKHGRAITSIRDNEIAARATGINVTKYKLLAFTVSAFFAGVAGVLYSYSTYKVQNSNFTYNNSIDILVMVVLGGMGSINGSIIAATIITYLKLKLPNILTNELAILQNLFYSLILIIVVIYNNSPALKGIREKIDIKKFFSKLFKKNDPSVIRDDQGKWERIPTKIPMDEVLSTDVQPQTSTLKPDKQKEEK